MLTQAATREEYVEEMRDEEAVVGFISLDKLDEEGPRGTCEDAFEAIRLLAGLNADTDSFCYALEEAFERAFVAGQEHERSKAVPATAPAAA